MSRVEARLCLGTPSTHLTTTRSTWRQSGAKSSGGLSSTSTETFGTHLVTWSTPASLQSQRGGRTFVWSSTGSNKGTMDKSSSSLQVVSKTWSMFTNQKLQRLQRPMTSDQPKVKLRFRTIYFNQVFSRENSRTAQLRRRVSENLETGERRGFVVQRRNSETVECSPTRRRN